MKYKLRTQAIKLRKSGYSIPDIASRLNVSKSTASLWCRDILLSEKQKKILEERTNRKLRDFFKLVEKQKKERADEKQSIIWQGAKEIGELSLRELFLTGVALYWAEGFKHEAEKRLGFCNSDPSMIKLQMDFWQKCLGVNKSDISPRLTINEMFRDQTDRIQNFWADILDIPLTQFTKPFCQQSKMVKKFDNGKSYHGVLRIHVRKSSKLMTRMRGWMLGLKNVVD